MKQTIKRDEKGRITEIIQDAEDSDEYIAFDEEMGEEND